MLGQAPAGIQGFKFLLDARFHGHDELTNHSDFFNNLLKDWRLLSFFRAGDRIEPAGSWKRQEFSE